MKTEFFLTWDSQEVPGLNRQIEAYCKKYGKFRPRLHGSAHSLAQAFELIANENVVYILPEFVSHYSPPGVVILPIADPEVTWKLLVIWRRGRTGGALKALLDVLLTPAPKANEPAR